MKDVMTTHEVADILGVHVYTVTGLIRDGQLKAFRVSNRYRIRKEALEEFMGVESSEIERNANDG